MSRGLIAALHKLRKGIISIFSGYRQKLSCQIEWNNNLAHTIFTRCLD